jgi:hypothetical protein
MLDNQVDKERLGKIADMEDSFKDAKDNREAVNVILDTNNEVDFIKNLESIADATGNKITLKINDQGVTATAQKEKKATANKNKEKTIKENLSYGNYVSVEIDIKGSYLQLVNFIRKLENYSYYVNIISVDTKKELESGLNMQGVSASSNIFKAPDSENSQEEATQPSKEKEILNSVINVVVYTKK